MLVKGHSLSFLLPSSPSVRRSNNRESFRVGFVRCGYSRIPLETAGAYQLVNDETGEKLIVWGGTEDNPQLPPKHLLLSSNWNPSASHNIPVAAKNDSTTPSKTRPPASFSRLKAQRVKALANRNSQKYQHVSKPADLPRNDSFGKKKVLNSLKQEEIFRDITVEDLDDSDAPQMVTDKFNPIRGKERVRVPGASASHLRGWGNGESTHNTNPQSTELPRQRNKSSADRYFFSRKSFQELGCDDYLIESLRRQSILRPSQIQAMAFAPITERKTCILADQSGSGKTLAYLLPVIQGLRREELEGLRKPSSGSPRVLIIVPTAELGSQVLSNCRSISKYGVPFRSMVVTGGFRQKTQIDNLQQGVDVLIATPGRFMFLIKEGFLQLTSLRCVVLDEVDILFHDKDFEVALRTLLSSSLLITQYLFVTATLPVDIYNKLVEVFPDCKVVMGPSMHRISAGLEEVVVDCSGDHETNKTPEMAFHNKKSVLLKLVEENPVSKTIIFCNKIETCRKVENILKRFNRRGNLVRVLPFHSAVEQESRLANMKEFTSAVSKEECLFLVCTDRASRGIDVAGVDHVVLFDFPRDPSEYVRRVGRTARGAGGKGKAYIFVVGKQVSLARKIMERNQKGHPVHDVPLAFELTG